MTTAALEPKETLHAERLSAVRRQEKAETAEPVAEAAEGRSFYIVTTLLGGVMFLLAIFACFIMSQTLLLR
jgi:hypothetical protein